MEDNFQGVDVKDIITKVKYALFVAQLRAGKKKLAYKLGGIDIELKVVETRDAQGKPVFKVPVLEWEIGTTLKISEDQTQTVKLSLEAIPDQVDEALTESFDIPLTEALLEIAEVADFASEGTPRLGLGNSSVSFQFSCTKDGKLTLLIFEGHLARATTHTLTVRLKAA